MYTSIIKLKDNQVSDLLYAAVKYDLPRLVEQCFEFGWGQLSPANVCSALDHAILYDNKLLQVYKMLITICNFWQTKRN